MTQSSQSDATAARRRVPLCCWAAKLLDLSYPLVGLLVFLCERSRRDAEDRPHCRVSLAALATRGGVSTKTVQRMLAELEAKKLIARKSDRGRYHANTYYICEPGKQDTRVQFRAPENRTPESNLHGQNRTPESNLRRAKLDSGVPLLPLSKQESLKKEKSPPLPPKNLSPAPHMAATQAVAAVSDKPALVKAMPLKAAQTELQLPLPQWLPLDAWNGFVEMRRKMRHPLVGRARELTLSKLADFRAEGFDPADILNESVMNGWRGIFRPKPNGNGASSPQQQKSRFQWLMDEFAKEDALEDAALQTIEGTVAP
jgi:hypothetical protein